MRGELRLGAPHDPTNAFTTAVGRNLLRAPHEGRSAIAHAHRE
jgi:hypothetical protein